MLKINFRPLIAATLAVCLSLQLSISARAGDEANEVLRVYHVPRAEINQLRYYGDVWGRNWRQDFVLIHVTPRGRTALEELGYTIETDRGETDRVAWFRNIDREAWRVSGLGGIPGFPCYRTVDETHATLADLAAAHPRYARLELIGQSWQSINNPPADGDIFSLVIANQDSPYDQAPLVIMAAQHARELTTAESATRFAELLLEERETDGDIAWLLDHREIHIIAQQNPDGRRQVEGQVVPSPPPQGFMWRKNHNTTACGTAASPSIGVDLNRNSSFLWGPDVWPGASSGNWCDQTYRGTDEASEPETETVETYLESVFDQQRPPDLDTPAPDDAQGIFISIHSFSELVLFPWDALGDGAANHSPNHDQLAYLGRKFGYHLGYQVGRDILYEANGTTTDYAYGQFGVASYTYELGTSFLQTCASFENTIWPDVREALLYAAKAAERPYQAPSGPDVVDLEATFDLGTGRVNVAAMADGTRYDRGGVSEGPAEDPVFDITGALASFDVPPHLAVETFDLTLNGTSSVVGVNGEIPLGCDTEQPRLLFVAATDAEGHTGVPTASWVGGLPSPQPPGELLVETQTHDFGEVGVGEAASVTVGVGNAPVACGELTLNGLELTGDGFTLGDGCPAGTVLAAGASCSIEVTFSPDAAGSYFGDLTIEVADGADGQNATVTLSGSGVQDPGELEVMPQSLDFGEVITGENPVLAVTASNVAAEGSADLAITQLEVIAGQHAFTLDDGGTCEQDVVLAPQESCAAEVIFSPLSAAAYSGVLRIEAGGETVNLNLSGNGVEPEPTVFEDRFEEN